MHIQREHEAADEFRNDFHQLVQKTKIVIMRGDYVAVFGWIQYVLRKASPGNLTEEIQAALEAGKAAYRLVDGDTIVPLGSEAEGDTIERAFVDLGAAEFGGARQHLRKAAEALSVGDNSGSIRESIHAVEAVVRVLEPDGNFAKALAKLDAKVKIHAGMRAGFNNLYGFTSDENGLRHSLLELPAANVDETDALFMIGACAAFVSYLINKARSSNSAQVVPHREICP